ncbi:CAP domain-containing protein [Chitinophaga sp. GCM10012297]|uniref:CAP domain-containing protein n=1 Tax=Chitinophaga chungangae TaxID=2821488 RepID=A0ABS3YFK3_9BACT|nr:CAP domain-containing protein [Chitinophaga chungangae]MBO9152904.1 CAP domain-containing protein [Chitinophaga chungangae]
MSLKLVRFVPLIVVISLFLASCGKEPLVQPRQEEEETGPGTVDVVENNVDKDLLLQLVNNVRAKGCNCKGTWMPPVEPVKWNVLLELAAAKHSNDMRDKKYFDHTSPSGSTPQSRVTATGFNYTWMGENIASGPSKEETVINGWLGSEGHCKNIMSPNFREMGVGRAGSLWTQVFGTSK